MMTQNFEDILGSTLRYLRKQKGMTQKELALGVCTQAQISRIENGEMLPSALICFELVHKLGMGIDYFYSLVKNPRSDYMLVFKEEVERLIQNRDYKELDKLIQSEKANPLFQNPDDQQFMLWHEGIASFHYHQDYKQAFAQLHEALYKVIPSNHESLYTVQEINIVHSLGVFYYVLKDYDNALITLDQALDFIDKRLIQPLNSIKIRVLFTKSQVLTDKGEYEEALKTCEKGITLALKNETFKLLGELYYQKGYVALFLSQKNTAYNCLVRSAQVFEITNNPHMTAYPYEIISSYDLDETK
ncbi:Xre family transcriptional regulator [Salsuginibacillus halophilus]|uniref:Xre family transcriptional regulator n=1 Tax=Salsuginibacillus halophilus TaxID=517424 RepID=A0A2P8H4X6_9BACI|nr:helix-turn-helix domain-containing protein [Salsuginibacillus halophilus]PSL41267.1 Xre family transcriptional regulator [Salsuginibacillus halophilus]